MFERDSKVATTIELDTVGVANAGAAFFLAPLWLASGTTSFLVSKFPLLRGRGNIYTVLKNIGQRLHKLA